MYQIFLIQMLLFSCLLCFPTFSIQKTINCVTKRTNLVLYANPVTSDGSNYGKYTSEEDAFLWFDEAMFYVRGGSGGAGSNAVRFGTNHQHRYPIGGNGGNGGNVVFVADSNINTLLGFRGQSHFRAENGLEGGMQYMTGKAGKDIYIPVPTGIVIRDNETDTIIGELKYDGEKLTVARGGLGGKGNAAFKTAVDRTMSAPPQGGQRRWLRVELKLVADVGLVGLPNAGKSTLLDAITNARPKIASYAFTTIVPNLGVCEVSKVAGYQANTRMIENGDDSGGLHGITATSDAGSDPYARMVIADIPGLIEGAHKGRGLGRGFLRHVERCKVLIHLVDGSSPNPIKDYIAINNELILFSEILASKPQVVVVNKIDIPQVSEKLDTILSDLRKVIPHRRLLTMSAASRMGTEELVRKTCAFLDKVTKDERDARKEEERRELELKQAQLLPPDVLVSESEEE